MDTLCYMLTKYYELGQLRMQLLSNCHLATFLLSIQILKKQPNDNLITPACVIALQFIITSYIAIA